MALQIGEEGWVKELKAMTRPLGAEFWHGFSPVSSGALRELERQIQRKLSDEFVEFYRVIGCGEFPEREGGFYTPQEIAMALDAPIYFVLGSQGSDPWCREDEHRRVWTTRGQFNPAPAQFTDDALTLEGVKLYDLLQFGTNGLAGYHQTYVGPPPSHTGYCLLRDGLMEDPMPTFSAGIEKLLSYYFPRAYET